MSDKKVRVVTPEQYRKGYNVFRGYLAEFWGGEAVIEPRPYVLVGRLPDGNYVVEEPQEPQTQRGAG